MLPAVNNKLTVFWAKKFIHLYLPLSTFPSAYTSNSKVHEPTIIPIVHSHYIELKSYMDYDVRRYQSAKLIRTKTKQLSQLNFQLLSYYHWCWIIGVRCGPCWVHPYQIYLKPQKHDAGVRLAANWWSLNNGLKSIHAMHLVKRHVFTLHYNVLFLITQ